MPETRTETTLLFEDYTIHLTKINTQPQGKSVLYLHGMCMHGAFYHGLVDMLPDDFANYYFIDLPHHGRSSGRKGFFPDKTTMVNCIDFAVKSILQNDGLQEIDLISAESMGSIVALYYLLMRDQAVQNKYLLFGAPLRLNWWFFVTDLKQPQTTWSALFDRDKMILPVKDLLGDMTRNAEVYEHIRKDSLVPEHANLNYILTIHGMLRVINARFRTITKEILFFYGENDAIANLKKIVKQTNGKENIRTIVVPNEFHSMFWADKDTYKPSIADWLNA